MSALEKAGLVKDKSFIEDTVDFIKESRAKAIAEAIAQARRGSLVVRLPTNAAASKTGTVIDISLKLWDVLSNLWEIGAMVKAVGAAGGAATISLEAIAATEVAAQAAAAAGSTKIMTALTFGEALSLAGPFVSYVALWVGLGAPYLEAKQAIADSKARIGVSEGLLVGAFGHAPERARGFLMRQGTSVNNHWIRGAEVVAQNSYRMSFIAGYKVGREMLQGQREVFWKEFAKTLRKEGVPLWKNDWHGDAVFDRFFREAAIVYMKHHLRT